MGKEWGWGEEDLGFEHSFHEVKCRFALLNSKNVENLCAFK